MTNTTENNRFQKALNELRAVKMSPQEKNALYERLMAKIKSMPADDGGYDLDADRSVVGSVASPWTIYSFKEWVMKHRMASMTATALAVVILASGGVAYAAKGALPGEPLYAVKVAVVEPIEGAFSSVSPVARAQWEAHLVATRLAEAQILEDRGSLDSSKQKKIQSLVVKHTTDFDVALEDSKSKEDADAELAGPKATIARGNSFLAASNTVSISASVAATSNDRSDDGAKATAASKSISAPVSHDKKENEAVTATSSGSPLPHIEDNQTVKNMIKETSAVVNAVSQFPTASAATGSARVRVVVPKK
jgi:hypothetical protein